MKMFREFVMPALVLTLICLVVSAALAVTYTFTKPVIEASEKAQADAARLQVLAKGDTFIPVEIEGIEGVVEAYEAQNGAGYVITTTAKGYGGSMQVMTGITREGTLYGVKLLENAETPGIGSQVGEAAYTDQYIGRDHTLEGIDIVSGATVSSNGFRQAVEIAFQAYAQLTGEEWDHLSSATPTSAQ